MAKVKVRIAVAVDPTGAWNSCGWKSTTPQDDEELMGMACEPLETGEAYYWLTAELDIPSAQEVSATVERASQG